MKFMVGLPKKTSGFVDYLIENSKQIYEVYFSWGDFPNGRSSGIRDEKYTEWELMDVERSALKKLSDAHISLNLLFNANCYGKDSQSRSFFNKTTSYK